MFIPETTSTKHRDKKHLDLHLFSFFCPVAFLYIQIYAMLLSSAVKFENQGQQKTTTHLSQTWSRAHTFQNHFKLLIQCGDCDKFCPLLGTLLTSRPLLPLRFVIPGVLSSSELSKSPLGTFTCWQIGLPRVQWLYLKPVWGPAIFTGMPQSPVANADPCRVCV